MNSLHKIINIQLKNKNLNEVSKAVGVSTELLGQILEDPYFGFVSGINPIESKIFLNILCSFTEMKLTKQQNKIEMFNRNLASYRQSLPYVFVDTNFVREGQPIFVLAIYEWSRRFKVDKDSDISSIIKDHYRQSGGELEMWGKIEKYIFHDSKDKIIVYNIDGEQIAACNINETKATLRL